MSISRSPLLNTQAGTLSGNPLAMAAGIKTMEILKRPGSYEHLQKITSKLVKGILDAGNALFWTHFYWSKSIVFSFLFQRQSEWTCG
jgi:glutamate-1-semialdehyde 2,1-aminomutase